MVNVIGVDASTRPVTGAARIAGDTCPETSWRPSARNVGALVALEALETGGDVAPAVVERAPESSRAEQATTAAKPTR
jgi:hypothetical protein